MKVTHSVNSLNKSYLAITVNCLIFVNIYFSPIGNNKDLSPGLWEKEDGLQLVTRNLGSGKTGAFIP